MHPAIHPGEPDGRWHEAFCLAARDWLGELSELNPQAKYADVVVRFKQKAEPDWTAAAQVIEMIMRRQNAEDVSELRGWARKVGRFLLHGPNA